MKWTNTLRMDAPAELIWELNTDVERWPTRTPTVQSVERLDDGPFRVGSQARIKQPGQPTATWTVTRMLPGHEFSWQSKRRGLVLTGTHRVQTAGPETRNTLEIEVTGPLSRVFGLLFGVAIRRALRLENAGFKSEASRQTSAA
jgi:uncharacterized membrane protein